MDVPLGIFLLFQKIIQKSEDPFQPPSPEIVKSVPQGKKGLYYP